jgi:Ala-tRNA(Pro) deacylase
MAMDPINCHPLTNDMTVALSPDGLMAFFRSTGHAPRFLDL